MTVIKSDSNPDKRDRAKPDNYLENWIERQSLVESMIPIIGIKTYEFYYMEIL